MSRSVVLSTDSMRRRLALSATLLSTAQRRRTLWWYSGFEKRRKRALGEGGDAASLRRRPVWLATRKELHILQGPGGKDGDDRTHAKSARVNGALDSDRVPEVPEAVLGPHGTARFLVNNQGIRLACYHWPVVPASGHAILRGVVVLVHGYAVHLTFSFLQSLELDPPKPYEGSWIHRMNLAGYAVWGIDNQSCGRSEGVQSGSRMYFHRFEDLCADVEQLIHVIKEDPTYAQLPLFMVGESMGGNICLHVSQKVYPLGILQGTVLLAPMIKLKDLTTKVFNRLLYPMRSLYGWLFRSRTTVGSGSTSQRDRLTRKQYERDPLNFHGASPLKVSVMTIQQCNETIRALNEFNFPFFILQSENDRICDPAGAAMLYNRSKSKVKKLCMLSDIDSYHFLAVEPVNPQILDDILDWLDHQSSGCTVQDVPSDVELQ